MSYGKKSQTFNGRLEATDSGAYFKILTAASAVDVELWQNGRLTFQASQVGAGFFQRMPFDKYAITTSGSELVEWLTAPDQGGSDTFSGNVDVLSLPSAQMLADNADTQSALGAASLLGVIARLQGWDGAHFNRLLALQDADAQASSIGALVALSRLQGWNGASFDRVRADNIGGAGTLRVTERGHTYTTSFNSTSSLATQSGETIATPATNVNGIIVWKAMIWTAPAAGPGSSIITLHANTSAPAGFSSGTILGGPWGANTSTLAGLTSQQGQLERAVFVPSGQGLYYFNSGGAEGAGRRMCLFTVL